MSPRAGPKVGLSKRIALPIQPFSACLKGALKAGQTTMGHGWSIGWTGSAPSQALLDCVGITGSAAARAQHVHVPEITRRSSKRRAAPLRLMRLGRLPFRIRQPMNLAIPRHPKTSGPHGIRPSPLKQPQLGFEPNASERDARRDNRRNRVRSCGRASRPRHISPAGGRGGISNPIGRHAAPA